MKKSTNFLKSILCGLALIGTSVFAQTYCFTAPEGHAAGVTGGGTPTASNTITVTTTAELLTALSGSKSVILVSGTLTFTKLEKVSFSNKSIIGLPGAKLVNNNTTTNGNDGTTGILYIGGGSNIIIRNLIFEGPNAYDVDGNDNLALKGATNVWVDHCDIRDGIDDCFDISGTSDNVTVSWTKISHTKTPIAGGSGGSADHRFADLVGGGETDYPADGGYSITWQNCWWADGNKDRMVRGRNVDIHMVNCYWGSSVASHNISLTSGTKGCKLYCENGVFATTCEPMIIDKAGSFDCQLIGCTKANGTALSNSDIVKTNSAVNKATLKAPTYAYTKIPTANVVAAVTNATCGAGATLQVSASGVVSSSCDGTPISVSGVSVSPTSATINGVGSTQQLTATVAPANASNQSVTWTSSNTAAATVSSTGLVTAVAAGTATITVKTVDGNKTATSAITVTAVNVAVTGVTLSPAKATINGIGSRQQLTATVAPTTATNKNVTYTSSNTAVATVNASGLVTAVTAGSATITVKTVDGNKTATSDITVTAVIPTGVYTYTSESFESSAWASAPSNGTVINASTGNWTVATNNIQSTTITAQSGTYSLVFANKTNALITPTLSKGAGTLTYYVAKTGSRTIYVETTKDNVTWTNVDTYVATATWDLRTIVINDKDVVNIRFTSNSNGGLYVDNVLITEPSIYTFITSKSENVASISSSVVDNELTVNGNGKAEIYALSGVKLISADVSGSSTIDVSSLSQGLYVVKIQGETFKFYKK